MAFELTRPAMAAEAVILLVIFGALFIAAIGMWLEGRAPERDEDDNLTDYARIFKEPFDESEPRWLP
jgi:hypothetical protein